MDAAIKSLTRREEEVAARSYYAYQMLMDIVHSLHCEMELMKVLRDTMKSSQNLGLFSIFNIFLLFLPRARLLARSGKYPSLDDLFLDISLEIVLLFLPGIFAIFP